MDEVQAYPDIFLKYESVRKFDTFNFLVKLLTPCLRFNYDSMKLVDIKSTLYSRVHEVDDQRWKYNNAKMAFIGFYYSSSMTPIIIYYNYLFSKTKPFENQCAW